MEIGKVQILEISEETSKGFFLKDKQQESFSS